MAGKIVLCGGYQESSCLEYSEGSAAWRPTTPMDVARFKPAAVELSEREWWVAGGWDENWNEVRSTLVYDGRTFRNGPDLPYPVFAPCLAKLRGNLLFLSGGWSNGASRGDAYLLNLETERWTKLADMRERRQLHGCHQAGDDSVVVVGGYDDNIALRSTEIFSLDRMTWSRGPDVPKALGTLNNIQHATVSQPGEETFLIIGGRIKNGTESSNRVIKYDPDRRQWQIISATLQNARYSHAAVKIPQSFNCDK